MALHPKGWRRLSGLVVGRKVVVRNLSRHRRARVNYKRQQEKRLDEEIANQREEEGDRARQHPLDDRDFEAWREEFYKLYKLSKFRRRVRDTKESAKRPEEAVKLNQEGESSKDISPSHHQHRGVMISSSSLCVASQIRADPNLPKTMPFCAYRTSDPSLADGYTHLSKTWLNRGGTTISTPPMANTDHTSPAINGPSRPIRDNKFEVVLSLVAALLFVIGGCLVLSFSSPEVNGALFAPIVCLFTAGYVVLILYDIISRSLTC